MSKELLKTMLGDISTEHSYIIRSLEKTLKEGQYFVNRDDLISLARTCLSLQYLKVTTAKLIDTYTEDDNGD